MYGGPAERLALFLFTDAVIGEGEIGRGRGLGHVTACAISGARAGGFGFGGVAAAAGLVVGGAGSDALVRVVAAYAGKAAGALLVALADQESNRGEADA